MMNLQSGKYMAHLTRLQLHLKEMTVKSTDSGLLGRDIYGNLESKNNYEYQVKIDTTTPDTEFVGFSSDYYFIGSGNLDLSWSSDDEDILAQNIEVYYTNFSEPYLNPNSVTWSLINDINVTGLETYNYQFRTILDIIHLKLFLKT